MVLTWDYRGFICPVFTPFDSEGELRLNEIPRYAKHLAKKNVKAILVNGTVGEGVCMSTEERMAVVDAWVRERTKYNFHIMVHVGGTYLKAVRIMAKHAEQNNVSAILCIADLLTARDYKNEIDLINYLQLAANAAPKTPFFYYHYPGITKTRVSVNVVKFLNQAYHVLPTLAGIKFTDPDLNECFQCTQVHNGVFTVFLGCDQLIAPALSMGIDSFIPTSLNYAADDVFKIQELVNKGKNEEAMKIQNRITTLSNFCSDQVHWINGFKETITMLTKVDLGDTRLPMNGLTKDQKQMLKEKLKSEKWMK